MLRDALPSARRDFTRTT